VYDIVALFFITSPNNDIPFLFGDKRAVALAFPLDKFVMTGKLFCPELVRVRLHRKPVK